MGEGGAVKWNIEQVWVGIGTLSISVCRVSAMVSASSVRPWVAAVR